MPITKAKKKEVYAKVETAVKGAKTLVFLNFHGLTVKDATEMRRALRTHEVGYMVAKKTITRKVLEAAGVTGDMPVLNGEVGMAYGADQIAPARETLVFEKKFDKRLSILGGVFDGKFMNKMEMMSVASIPGRQTLYAQFANVINSPIQGLVLALNAIAKKNETPAA